MRPTIRINQQLAEHPAFINVEGDIDVSTAKAFRQALIKILEEDNAKLLLIRLKHVPYMDSSGVAVLLEIIKKCYARDSHVAILEPSSAAKRAMAIVDLDALIKVYPTVEECASCTTLAQDMIREYVYSDQELADHATSVRGSATP